MNSIGSSPSSSGPPNETPKPSQDQQGLFSRIGQVVRNVFNRTTAPSTRNIDAALHTSQDSEAEASAGRNSPTPSTSASSPPSSRPSSPAPLTADSDASLKAAAMQATEKKS
ncbi:MAG: hypothetical protein LVR00_01610 [Rhabdochlamydiaceae bacterium]|jgi:hypothetical protein